MKTPALTVDKHILGILTLHAELAMHDAAHMELPGLDPLTLRAQLWEELIDFVALRAEDEEFALDFDRRRARRNAFVAGGDQAVAEVEALLYECSFDTAPADVPTARPFQVAAYLQRMAADVDFGFTGVTRYEVDMMLRGWGMDAATRRAQVRLLADRFDLAYDETDTGDWQTKCNAAGKVGGVPVELWGLVPTAELEAAGDAELPAPTPGLAERTADILAVAAGMQAVVPDGRWNIWASDPQEQIKVSVHRDGLTALRAEVRRIAAALNLAYDEKPHSEAFGMKVFARGDVDGVTVEVYGLAKPDAPETADDGGALNDAGRDVAEEAWQRAEAEREGQEELAAEEEHFAEVAAQFADCAAGDDQAAAAERGVDL